MKKIFSIFAVAVLLSCSGSDDSGSSINTRISPASFTYGSWECEPSPWFPAYPVQHPKYIWFTNDNVIVQGQENTSQESLQMFIDDLESEGRLINVIQHSNINNQTNYHLEITYRPSDEDDAQEGTTYHTTYKVRPVDENSLYIEYQRNGNNIGDYLFTRRD